jgi:hypothetical protein
VWCADLDPVAVAHNIEASGAFDQLIAFEHPTTTVPLAARNRSSVQRLLGAPDAAS